MKSFNKKRIKLTIIVSLLLMLVVSSGLLILNSNIGKNRELDEVRLNNNKGDSSMFAIMIEQADGSYEESDSSTWPTDRRKVYDEKLSGCIDKNGNAIENSLSYDEVNNKVILRTQQALVCYLYFSYPTPDVAIAVDNTKGTSQTGKYKRVIDCGNTANAIFNPIYQRVEIGSITSPSKCTLNYIEDTKTYTTLISEVESKATEITDAIGPTSDATYTTLTYNEYSNIQNTSSKPFVWDEENSYWTISGTENRISPEFIYYPDGNAAYQICYSVSGTTSEDYSTIYFYVNSDTFLTIYSDSNGGDTITGCYNIGYLTPSSYIKIFGYLYDSNVSFYITKTNDLETFDVGYRYIGKQPDNWIWFNGEKWRIIGSLPTKQSNGLASNLVKIIRNSPIGQLIYNDNNSNTRWGSNSLSRLLNEKYYGKLDATETYYCSKTSSTYQYVLCNYKEIGISNESTDYYGRMIKSAYWNAGVISGWSTPIQITYVKEAKVQSAYALKIGLISASDYGYATSGISYDSIGLSSLDAYEQDNWLYSTTERTLTPYNSAGLYLIDNDGGMLANGAKYGYLINPVVYLDSSVYIIDGDGTEGSPYQIGM